MQPASGESLAGSRRVKVISLTPPDRSRCLSYVFLVHHLIVRSHSFEGLGHGNQGRGIDWSCLAQFFNNSPNFPNRSLANPDVEFETLLFLFRVFLFRVLDCDLFQRRVIARDGPKVGEQFGEKVDGMIGDRV